MSGRYGRLAVAEDAAGRAQSRGARSRLEPEVDHIINTSGAQIDALSRDLKRLVKAYMNIDTSNDFGEAMQKKIEKVFERCDRMRGIYNSVY